MKVTIIFFFSVMILFSLITIEDFPPIVTGSDMHVNINGSTEYQSIQEAIDIANPGDTIYVLSGYYHENIVISKSIVLRGEDKSNTTIDGKGGDVILVISDDVNITGFTITNGTNGITLDSSSNDTITNNTIRKNIQGILITNNSNNNMIHSNNLCDNTYNEKDDGSNIWNAALVGNYWDTYTGKDANHDGIGDTPYNISGGTNMDSYPLMHPLSDDPIALFTFDPSYPSTDDLIMFTDNSSDDEGILLWQWDFDDGSKSNQQHPTHKFSDNGEYNVSLTVTDIFGLMDTATITFFVRNVPPHCVFSFTPSQPTDIENVLLQDASTDGDGYIVNWSWDFGNNSTYFGKNVSYQFPDDGSYPVSLVVTDDDGATTTDTKVITVMNVAPTVSFSCYSDNITFLIGSLIHFNDHSFDPDGSIVNYSWDFGDGTISSEKSPTHTYDYAGTFTVSLSVIDDDDASSSFSKPLTASVVIQNQQWDTGLNTFDIFFIVFICVMVVMVFFISRKFRA
ncbi:MAG: PKD domain-containing protein [Thermoplasmatota archaeon]